jgi:hypothetical protein
MKRSADAVVNVVVGYCAGKRCCSLDGDADRVVYHYFDNGGV